MISSNKEELKRTRTYIQGVDEKIEGGIPDRSIVLISGPSGSMKTTLVYYILYKNVIHANKKGTYISLEQSRLDLIGHMERFGLDKSVDPTIDANLTVIDLGELRSYMKDSSMAQINWLQSLVNQIETYKREMNIDMVCIDSLNAIYSLATMENPRDELFHFFKGIKALGITAFIISEMPPDRLEFGKYGIEDFLSDAIIHMDVRRSGSSVNLYFGITKMRKTAHDRNYFPFIAGRGNFSIVIK